MEIGINVKLTPKICETAAKHSNLVTNLSKDIQLFLFPSPNFLHFLLHIFSQRIPKIVCALFAH